MKQLILLATLIAVSAFADHDVRTGKAALDDYHGDAPGVRRKITVDDLPPPHATKSVDSGPHQVKRPEGAWPKAPAGFTVELVRPT